MREAASAALARRASLLTNRVNFGVFIEDGNRKYPLCQVNILSETLPRPVPGRECDVNFPLRVRFLVAKGPGML